MRWCKIVCLCISGLGPVHSATPYDAAQATTDATAASGAAKTYIGTSEALRKNAQLPMTSNTNMLSYNGQQFNGQISCASPQPFFEMLVQPAATGDINVQSILQDTNLDGTMDVSYSLPTSISGVCANGIISCNAGTWSGCMAYTWGASTNGQVTLTSAPLSSVGGCYCVNNHCGNNLVWNNIGTVMGDIAGGAIAAVIANKPSLAIADVRVNGPSIKYYSQNMGSCADPASTAPIQHLSAPFSIASASTAQANTAMSGSTPSSLPAAGAFSEQMANGVYQTIVNSPIATNSATTTQTCKVKRIIPLDEVTDSQIMAYNGGTGGISSCGSGCFNLVLGLVGDNYLGGTCSLHRYDVSFWVLRPDRIISATLARALFDDHIQISANNALLWSHAAGWSDLSDSSYPPGTFFNRAGTPFCERKTSWNIYPNLNFTANLKVAGPHNFKVRVAASGGGEGYAYAQVLVDNSCQLLPDIIDNQCAALESNSDCTLQQETVDGALTYSNFNPTGLVPLPSTTTIAGASCNVPASQNWWEKDRRYTCLVKNTYNFTDEMKRKANIDATTTASGYQDYTKGANGQWSPQNNPLTLPTLPPATPCMTSCKAKKPRELLAVSGMGVADDLRNLRPAWDFVYHECSNNTCPLQAGEVLVKACACINEFAESTAIMQTMRLGAKDMICTTGLSATP